MKPVTIVGGGLAGLSLGILLRRRGVSAVIFEAGKYPRHRVCGEFISGRGADLLKDLVPFGELEKAGARLASDVLFVRGKEEVRWRLPIPAIAISRYALDALLSREFLRAGGELRENERWRGEETQPGTVLAAGRRIAKPEGGLHWVGVKAHASGISLRADLEMHFLTEGYIGLCQHSSGVVNVCGLFRAQGPIQGLAGSWPDFLGAPGTSVENVVKRENFLPETFCAVAGLDPFPRALEPPQTIRIGDALGMAPPVTGNGMSAAFESASLAAPLLALYAAGQLEWLPLCAMVHRSLRRTFRARFKWDRLLQRLLMRPMARSVLFGMARAKPALLEALFAATH